MKLLFSTCMTIFTIITSITDRWINPFIILFDVWTWCGSKIIRLSKCLSLFYFTCIYILTDYDDDHEDYDIEDKHNLVDKDVEDVYMVQFYN